MSYLSALKTFVENQKEKSMVSRLKLIMAMIG